MTQHDETHPFHSLGAKIDSLCDQFESQWKQGARPELEQFLSQPVGPEKESEPEPSDTYRRELFNELLRLEVYYRQRFGEDVDAAEYHVRFPEFANEINIVFESVAKTRESEPGIPEETVDLGSITKADHSTSKTKSGGHFGQSSRFEIMREHARGGLGEIYVAKDCELNREVALKEIRPEHSDDEGSRSRFLLEAEVTGGLEHPGIVPVYGLGKYPDGRPFYAMRFIRGDSLQEATRAFHGATGIENSPANETKREQTAVAPDFQSVAFRKLLGRFVDVCQAVEYAHSRGVLHRDLKPGNIMLGKYGETLVVDWGLAKTQDETHEEMAGEALLQPASASGSAATVMGSAIGTPAFMPPEQAAGDLDNVGPASDVYSLGATLYFMLTGRVPFQGNVSAVLNDVKSGQFVTPRGVQAAVPKSLEAVCLKAMMTSTTDRYTSPIELADDIERYLADEPVSVLVEPWFVRLRRWLRKHQTLAASSAAVVLVLIIGLAVFSSVVSGKNAKLAELNGTLTDEQARTSEALARVTEEQQKTLTALNDLKASRTRNLRNLRQVTKKLVPDLISRIQKLSDSDRTFVSGLLPMWQEVASARGNTADAIKLRGEAHFAVAKLQGSLGQYAEARQGYQEALKMYRQLSGATQDKPTTQRAIARTHNNLGIVLINLGQMAEALDQMRASRAIQAQLAAKFPSDFGQQRDLATMHSNIGIQLSQGTDLKGALKEFDSAQSILKLLTSKKPDEPNYSSALAIIHLNRGNLFHRFGKTQESLKEYRAAVNLYEGLTGQHPNRIEYRSNFAQIHTNLGTVLSEIGELAKAENELRSALAVREKLSADFPAVSEYRSQLTNCHVNLAVLLAAAGKPAEAEKHYKLALDLLAGLLQQSPGTPKYRALRAATHDNLALVLGDIQRADRKPADAEEHHRTAIALWDELRDELPNIPRHSGEAAASRNHLGLLLFRMDRHDEAEKQYREALIIIEEMVAEFPDVIQFKMDLAASCCNFGKLVVTRGEPSEGLKWLDKAIGLMKARVRSEAKDMRARKFLRNSHWVRAEAYDKLGRTADATADWNEAVKLSPRREQYILRAKRGESRARAGLTKEAVEEIDAIASVLAWPSRSLYDFAVVYAIASDKVEDAKRKKQYADKAIKMLQQAIKAGWKDADRIANDPDLQSLRERDDFRKLLSDLAA